MGIARMSRGCIGSEPRKFSSSTGMAQGSEGPGHGIKLWPKDTRLMGPAVTCRLAVVDRHKDFGDFPAMFDAEGQPITVLTTFPPVRTLWTQP